MIRYPGGIIRATPVVPTLTAASGIWTLTEALQAQGQGIWPGYRANAVNFDGTNDYLTLGAGLTGAADSKLLTLSFWIRKQGSDGVAERIIRSATTVGGATSRVVVTKNTLDKISIQGVNAAGTSVLIASPTDDTVEVADGWVHILCSVDLADTGKRHLYLNDASDATWSTYTDDLIEFTEQDWAIGATPDGSGKLNADLADLWFLPGTYIDFSVTANRRLFISATGKPVYLGATGERPTGTSALIYLSGATAGWETNLGTGGGFTENGALSTSATSPSD